jgi:hypothetical protein
LNRVIGLVVGADDLGHQAVLLVVDPPGAVSGLDSSGPSPIATVLRWCSDVRRLTGKAPTEPARTRADIQR